VASVDRRRERRPAGAGIEFGARGEQRRAAADARVRALRVVVPILAGERTLRAFLARDLELLRRQLRLPFGFGLDDLVDHGAPRCCRVDDARRLAWRGEAMRYSVGCARLSYIVRRSLDTAIRHSFRHDARVIALVSVAHSLSHFLQLAL